MKRKKLTVMATASLFALMCLAAIAAENAVSSKIEYRVEQQLPSASGISVSVPLLDIPSILKSDSINSVEIKINEYRLKNSDKKSSLTISAKRVSKSKPTQIGFLNITSTVPVSQLLAESGFNDAKIVDGALQISVGAGGFGQALIVPKYSNNQIYFQIKSVSVMGSPIPASSLPADIQEQIKNQSQRSLTPPKGLKVKSVSLSSKGLSVKMYGNNVQLGKLGF